MILICVGSCLFTILSKESDSGSADRIASNIVTGIGFIGAGVIFKEGISINGITTAALIWVTAALGMAIGFHNYPLTIVVAAIVVIVLFILEPVQRYFERFHKVKDYRIHSSNISPAFRTEIETFFEQNKFGFRCMKASKDRNEAVYLYRVSASDRNYTLVDEYLINHISISGFEV
jgi:putative Mg2+ transporter-C (MgtC) family protein